MRKLTFFSLLLFLCSIVKSQCLIPGDEKDSLFPITNVYNTVYSSSAHIIYKDNSSVFNVTAKNGVYYLLGNFSNLAKNQGSALVIDSASNTVFTQRKWKINGTVSAAVADGRGGFYLCGEFSKIGDSSRRYLAQIDNNGQPTAWNPEPNAKVTGLYKKGDSLLIAGAFSSILSKPRNYFTIYSLSGDSVLKTGSPDAPLVSSYPINCFLLQKDTLLFGNTSTIAKYNLKDNKRLSWQLNFLEYDPVRFMQFNIDSSNFMYVSDYNPRTIKGVNTLTGLELYKIDIVGSTLEASPSGEIYGFKVVGNKAYAVGYFQKVMPKSGMLYRNGFFSFDATTGTISNDDLKCDGYPTFLETDNNRLVISGRFTKIDTVSRENFAVIDTGTLRPGRWQLAPTDPLTSIAFSNGRTFIGGHFNGINAVHRHGFAAIDSATNTILPWSPDNTVFTEGKRMTIKGDTLFVLGITSRPNSCSVNDFNTEFQMFSLSTGKRLYPSTSMFNNRMDDFIIDSNYLYASVDRQIRRFPLSTLTRDNTWGFSWVGAGGDHSPVYLIMNGNELYALGDNRFISQCTTLPERTGWFTVYNKQTGNLTRFYPYKDVNPEYNYTLFDHGLLVGNTLYIQGYFSSLNNKERHNFAAIDVRNGALTNWQTPFSKTGKSSSFQRTSDLKLYGGKIWFGSGSVYTNNSQYFSGLGAIDTATGALMPALFVLKYWKEQSDYLKNESFTDFLFTKNSFIGVGSYDTANGAPSVGLIKTKLINGSSLINPGSKIVGPDTLFLGTAINNYYLQGGNRSQNVYSWSYSGSGVTISKDGNDSILVKVDSSNATSGLLSVKAATYCDTAAALQKKIVIIPPPLPPVPVILNVVDKCFGTPAARAKLMNPPPNTAIAIKLDSTNIAYNAADSSFEYFYYVAPAGKHKISVTYTNVGGTSRKDTSYTVTVITVPTAVSITTPSTTVCKGTPVTFTATAATSSGVKLAYQWQVNGINVGTNDSSYTTDSLPDNAQVKVIFTTAGSCIILTTVTSNTIVIKVNPSIKTAGTARAQAPRICTNTTSSIIFTGNNVPTGCGIQLFEGINGSFAAGITQTYMGTPLAFSVNAGTTAAVKQYFFKIAPLPSVCGLAGNSDTVTVTVEQLDIPAIAANDVVLTVTNPDPAGGYSWQMQDQSGSWTDLVPKATGISFTAAINGTYRVKNIKGVCTQYSNQQTVSIVISNGVRLHLYPNPTKSSFIIDTLKLSDQWERLEVIDLQGRVRLSEDIKNQTLVNISIADLPAGEYIVILKRKEKTPIQMRIIKL